MIAKRVECGEHSGWRTDDDNVVQVREHHAVALQCRLGALERGMQGQSKEQRAERIALQDAFGHLERHAMASGVDSGERSHIHVIVCLEQMDLTAAELGQLLLDHEAVNRAVCVGTVDRQGNPVAIGVEKLARGVDDELDASRHADTSLDGLQASGDASLLLESDGLGQQAQEGIANDDGAHATARLGQCSEHPRSHALLQRRRNVLGEHVVEHCRDQRQRDAVASHGADQADAPTAWASSCTTRCLDGAVNFARHNELLRCLVIISVGANDVCVTRCGIHALGCRRLDRLGDEQLSHLPAHSGTVEVGKGVVGSEERAGLVHVATSQLGDDAGLLLAGRHAGLLRSGLIDGGQEGVGVELGILKQLLELESEEQIDAPAHNRREGPPLARSRR